jgi:Ca-activated chloride channel family protein
MELKYTVNPYIPVTRQRHLVYALVEVDPGEIEPASAAALNLGLVVDASRSMSIPILTEAQFKQLVAQGMAKQKTVDGVQVWQFEVPKGFHIDAPSNMDFTKEALRIVVDYLRPIDRFSLVAFAEDALLMIGSTSGAQKSDLLQAIERLDRIDLGDETFMARGMETGYQQAVRGTSPDAVNRMIVLTDGYTREEHDCYTWARQAKKEGIVVSTMGLGMDFNEDLLISLADVSGGHAYFIEDPQEIPNAFRQELSGAQSVAWRNLSLDLDMPTDVALRRAHRVSPAIASVSPEQNRIVLGDLESGTSAAYAPPAVLLEWLVPPRPAGTYRIARVELYGQAPGSSADQAIDGQDILVHYTERPSEARQPNPHLMSVIQSVSAFKLQNQAMEEARRGNVEGATRRLRMAGERLIEMGEEDLGNTMLVEAELMEKEGQMSAEGTKKLRYGTRKLK